MNAQKRLNTLVVNLLFAGVNDTAKLINVLMGYANEASEKC